MALNASPLWQANPIQYLINDKYPLLYMLALKAGSLNAPKPDPELSQEVADFRKSLGEKSLDEISLLVTEARQREAERQRLHDEKQEAEAFFNQPTSNADFSYWSRISYWTLEEGVALSLGKNPAIVSSHKLTGHNAISPFKALYATKLEEVRRARTMGQLWDSTIPFVFTKWAKRVGFEMPEELTSRVLELGVQIRDWKEAYEQQVKETQATEGKLEAANQKILELLGNHTKFIEKTRNDNNSLISSYQEVVEQRDQTITRLKEDLGAIKPGTAKEQKADLGPREKGSLLKLILGMAIKGYSFDPKATRSTQVQEIADDLLTLGLSLDVDTVRKYLNEAKATFSGEINRTD